MYFLLMAPFLVLKLMVMVLMVPATHDDPG